MKHILAVLITVACIAIGCDDGKKKFGAKFDRLMAQNDSIEKMRSEFKNMHAEMIKGHDDLMKIMENTSIEDSSIMAGMAKHTVIFNRHDAMIKGHDAIMEGQRELKEKFTSGELAAVEMEAQIEEMIVGQKKVMKEFNEMKDEHTRILAEHDIIKGYLQQTNEQEPQN